MMLTFYDAAYPPAAPPKTDGVCIYIGGDTPHVWSSSEIARQRARFRLPIWVRSDPQNASANADAHACLLRLQAIGCPPGSLVALDVETAVSPTWVHAFYAALHAAGYPIIVYGSQSVVLGNDNPDGWYWGADWSGHEHFARGDVMTQYADFQAYDLSDAQSNLPFWDTLPKPVTTPPPGFSITGHNGFANLGWGAVPGATDYNIEIRGVGGAGTGTSAANFTVNAPMTHAHRNLNPGHYIGRIRAGNVHGWSEWTSEHGFLVMKP